MTQRDVNEEIPRGENRDAINDEGGGEREREREWLGRERRR